MDQPAPAEPNPAQSATPSAKTSAFDEPSRNDEQAGAASAAPAPKVPSFDFGKPPAAPSVAPEPMSNWRERETPKSADFGSQTRPASVPQPAVTPSVSGETRSSGATQSQPERVEPSVDQQDKAGPSSETGVGSEQNDQEPLVVGKPQPDDDSFDFDFGFGSSEVEESAAQNEPEAATGSYEEVDPIADLISAELDANETAEEPVIVPGPVRQPSPQQAPRDMPKAPQAHEAAPRVPGPSAGEPARDEMTSAPRVDPVAAQRPGQDANPSAQAPAAERDPMDEIESLIGEAVRVELAAPERPARGEEPKVSTPAPTPTSTPRAVEPTPATQSGAPVVPPLTTGFAPRRAAIKESEATVSSAEAAILAAAASAGAEVDRNDSRVRANQAYRRPKAKPEQKRTASGGARQYIGMAVAGTLLLAAGLGLYWVFNMGSGPTDAEAPVLSADATPTKEAPPPEAESEATNSVVFDELDGVETTGEEQLVSRDGSEETSVADVARPVGDSDIGDSELANRKVRTVTVRPDGTIVSGDDALAGSEPLPVDRPTVPELPGADVQPSELLASIPDSEPATTDVVAPVEQPSSDTDTVLAQPSDPANIDPSVVAPVPMPRPTDRSRLASGTATPVASNSAPLNVDAPATASGPYVQLSSQRTEGDAQASLRTLQSRLNGLLNGAQLQVRPVNLGSKGVWYRVVLPTGSFQQATQACATIKANGSDCVPING